MSNSKVHSLKKKTSLRCLFDYIYTHMYVVLKAVIHHLNLGPLKEYLILSLKYKPCLQRFWFVFRHIASIYWASIWHCVYIHACSCAHAYGYSHQKSNCAARDTKDRIRFFCIAEISSRLSGIPYVVLCRLSRFLVSLIGHAFHVPQTVCIIFYILWKTKDEIHRHTYTHM